MQTITEPQTVSGLLGALTMGLLWGLREVLRWNDNRNGKGNGKSGEQLETMIRAAVQQHAADCPNTRLLRDDIAGVRRDMNAGLSAVSQSVERLWEHLAGRKE